MINPQASFLARFILVSGALFALLAVVLGAFGAHGLEKQLTAQALQRYETGVTYQFYHSLGLLLLGTLILCLPEKAKQLRWVAYGFILGIILFSGSLYAYAMSGITSLGMITPFGGMSFIIAWGALCWILLNHRPA
jgi:uncharacterized membrane protein YgdD (TMEM256/DUF423 family)